MGTDQTPIEQFYTANTSVVARTKLSDVEALRLIRGVVHDLDPNVAVYATGSMVEMLALPLFPAKLAASALGAFGVLGAILAATGIYGVMAYAVSRRTREIGIRMAIGASQGKVLGMAARRAAILIGTGTMIGLGVRARGVAAAGGDPVRGGGERSADLFHGLRDDAVDCGAGVLDSGASVDSHRSDNEFAAGVVNRTRGGFASSHPAVRRRFGPSLPPVRALGSAPFERP